MELTKEIKEAVALLVKDGMDEVEAKKKVVAGAEAKQVADAAELKTKIDDGVKTALKEIKIEDIPNFSMGQFTAEKELKVFDTLTGELVGVKKVDEKYAMGNKMMRCILSGDKGNAVAISDNIHQENDKINALHMERLGIKAPTPTLSDTTTRGGYAIPAEVSMEIMQLVYKESVMYQLANKNAIIFESKLYPVMYGITMADIADQETAVTESSPTFSNPTVEMKRMGAFSAMSNRIARQKGADIMNAFKIAYGSAAARFLDQRLAAGNVTNNGDSVDGIMFDPNTVLDTEVADASFGLANMRTMKTSINSEVDQNSLRWICNRSVEDRIGVLENSAGQLLFPQYLNGGQLRPLGIPLVVNPQIPSVLDIGSDTRSGGTDDGLILADMSKVMVGLSPDIMIDMSKDFYFTTDLLAIRGIQDYGQKVLMSSTQATGGVARVLALT